MRAILWRVGAPPRRAAPRRVACRHVHPQCSHVRSGRAAPGRRRAARGWAAAHMRGGTRRVEVGCRAAVAPPAAAASRAWIHTGLHLGYTGLQP